MFTSGNDSKSEIDSRIWQLINIYIYIDALKSYQFSTKIKVCSYDYLLKHPDCFLCFTITLCSIILPN